MNTILQSVLNNRECRDAKAHTEYKTYKTAKHDWLRQSDGVQCGKQTKKRGFKSSNSISACMNKMFTTSTDGYQVPE